MQQDKVSRLSDVGKNVWDEDGGGTKTPVSNVKKASFGQRWAKARPTKTIVFCSWIAAVVLTMIVGFNWGGWVLGGTAQNMARSQCYSVLNGQIVGDLSIRNIDIYWR